MADVVEGSFEAIGALLVCFDFTRFEFCANISNDEICNWRLPNNYLIISYHSLCRISCSSHSTRMATRKEGLDRRRRFRGRQVVDTPLSPPSLTNRAPISTYCLRSNDTSATHPYHQTVITILLLYPLATHFDLPVYRLTHAPTSTSTFNKFAYCYK